MIYLSHTSEAQEVFIPKSKRNSQGSVSLKLVGTISHVGMMGEVELLEDAHLYYRIKVELNSEIAPGEYEYEFSDMHDVLSSGILVVVASGKVLEYNKIIEYEQYSAE